MCLNLKALACMLALAAAAGWSDQARAQAVERIEMHPGDFGDQAWFLEPFIAEKWEQTELADWYVREQHVAVGRVDLDADGHDEIILQIRESGYCGSVGCETYVFQRRGEHWTTIGGGSHDSGVLTERICGYRSLTSRDGIDRWNGQEYAFAYCFPRENQCRSIAIEYDRPEWPGLEHLNPQNGLLAPHRCPDPQTATKLPQGHWISTTARAVKLNNEGSSPVLSPDAVFDLIPGDYGADTAFINRVVAENFETDPPPKYYSRARNIHIGRIDVNEDGVPELFIANYHGDACATDTLGERCPFLLFQRDEGGWQKIGEGRLRYAVFLQDETIDGYRGIVSHPEIYRWTGERYEAVAW